jgi:hypothetical protein
MPTYLHNQIVFLVDQTPSPAGVSLVLKTPNVGPYSELIRPVSLKEFKLILANQWGLHSQYTKVAKPHF